MGKADEVQRCCPAFACFSSGTLWWWPAAGSVFPKGLLQRLAWSGAIEKSGQRLFGGRLGVGFE